MRFTAAFKLHTVSLCSVLEIDGTGHTWKCFVSLLGYSSASFHLERHTKDVSKCRLLHSDTCFISWVMSKEDWAYGKQHIGWTFVLDSLLEKRTILCSFTSSILSRQRAKKEWCRCLFTNTSNLFCILMASMSFAPNIPTWILRAV